ncbi:helix-turn-helix domain-containing protein [Deferrisoma camini]|uniref:helix-turn-helix domain-containing protein n=1 Tax=Deferrisoma camini TaxID=1035120 RepID=UPI00046D7950|nr:helix-turn-helix transcriptional regulator [Deferrisoma camini]
MHPGNRPAIHFAAFVFWLLLFPLQGPFFALENTPPPPVAAFLLPHAAGLALLGASGALRRMLLPASVGGGVVAAGLTALYPFFPAGHGLVLGVLGAVSAPLAVRVAGALARSDRPLVAGAWALVAANLVLPLAARLPGPPGLRLLAAAAVVLVPLWRPVPPPPAPPSVRLLHGAHLGFLLAIYALNGVFYEKLFPAYARVAWLPGAELAAYAGAVLAAVYLGRGRAKPTLVLGVAFGFAALAVFRTGGAGGVNAGMGLMQGGSGFLDAFVLAYCLGQPDPARGFALGLASVCGGLGLGCLAAHGPWAVGDGVPLLGAFFVNGALLVLYAVSGGDVPGAAPGRDPTGPSAAEGTPTGELVLPRLGAVPLSSREREVAVCMLQGLSNRAIAERLGISPSSVQTYARRIYAKVGVSGREELLERLRPPAAATN